MTELTLWKKLLAVFIIIVIGILCAYFVHSCSRVSAYSYSLDDLIGNAYASGGGAITLTFQGKQEESALVSFNDTGSSISYNGELVKQDNLLLIKTEEKKYIFIALSQEEILYQNRNEILKIVSGDQS